MAFKPRSVLLTEAFLLPCCRQGSVGPFRKGERLMKGLRWTGTFLFFLAAGLFFCQPGQAMHISEGILPASWAGLWFIPAVLFVLWGTRQVQRRSQKDPRFKTFVALVGSAVFIVSCMPIPVPVAGTCSHPCGTGLAAILIGPGPTILVASIALLLQALFLAHGGLSTLGANILSMGVMGSMMGYGVFWLMGRARAPFWLAAFLAGALSDWATYAMTSVELGLGLSIPVLPVLLAFIPTQLPLGLVEGLLSAGALRFVASRRPSLLRAGLSQEPERRAA